MFSLQNCFKLALQQAGQYKMGPYWKVKKLAFYIFLKVHLVFAILIFHEFAQDIYRSVGPKNGYFKDMY